MSQVYHERGCGTARGVVFGLSNLEPQDEPHSLSHSLHDGRDLTDELAAPVPLHVPDIELRHLGPLPLSCASP